MKKQDSSPMFARYLETPELTAPRGGVSVAERSERTTSRPICLPTPNSSTAGSDVDYDNE